MDMSEFDVILSMDWLTAHRVVIDCYCRRVTAYTWDGVCVMFQGDKHGVLPQTVYDSRWHGQLRGWLASLTLEDEVRQDVSLPRVVCECNAPKIPWNFYNNFIIYSGYELSQTWVFLGKIDKLTNYEM